MGLPNKQLASAYRKSGKTQDSFCAEQSITIHKLRYYLYKKGKRLHTPAAKNRITDIPRIPQPTPVEFISFASQAGNNNDRTMQRQPVTIITGRFFIDEIIELIVKAGAAVC